MKYEIDLPAEVERRLTEKASETGYDVVYLIRAAVVRFVDEEVPAGAAVAWSDDVQARRSNLIDKDIAGTISDAERSELAQLDRLANEHFDKVAAPPLEGAKQLHRQLIQNPGKHG